MAAVRCSASAPDGSHPRMSYHTALAMLERGAYSRLHPKDDSLSLHELAAAARPDESPMYPLRQRRGVRGVDREFNQYRTLTPIHAAPTSRLEHAVAAVPITHRDGETSMVVIHGGRKNDNGISGDPMNANRSRVFDDTYAFLPNQNIWQKQEFDTPGPGKRFGHSLVAIDQTENDLLLFGGNCEATSVVCNDLWKMKLNIEPPTWQHIIATTRPPAARSQHAAAVVDGKMYVYGGFAMDSSLLGDLWIWNPSTNSWADHTSSCANMNSQRPPSSAEHTLVAVDNNLILFGGNQSDASGGFWVSNDTWILDTTTLCWDIIDTNAEDMITLRGRMSHSAEVFGSDGQREMHILFGRNLDLYPQYPALRLLLDSANGYPQYTWLPVNTSVDAVTPVARGGQTVAVYNTSEGQAAVIFGGECRLASRLGLPFRDTWSYTHNNLDNPFTNLKVLDYPSNLLSHTAAVVGDSRDPSSQPQICIFGGSNLRTGFQNALWCLKSANDSEGHDFSGGFIWRHKRVSTAIAPSPRADSTAVSIGSNSPQMFINGGRDHFAVAINELPLSDTFVYIFENFSWVEIKASNSPAGRMAHSSVVSSNNNSVFSIWIFGGVVGGVGSVDRMTSDVYKCDYNPTTFQAEWSLVEAASSVSVKPRAWHSSFWMNESLVIWGGRLDLAEDLHLALELDIFDPKTRLWRTLEPQGPKPEPRYAHASDALSSSRFVIFGGFSANGVLADVWVFDIFEGTDGSWWKVEQSSTYDYPRGYHSVSFWAETNELLVYGGTSLDLSDNDEAFEGGVPSMILGCNPGYSSIDFASTACEECPHGTFTDQSGSLQCSSCPRDITTNESAATTEEFCTLCQPGYCKNGGTCSVVDLKPSCQCSIFYTNTAHCDAIGWYWVAVPTVFAFVVVAILLMKRARRYRRKATSFAAESQAKGRHLAEMYRHWKIEPSSIKVTTTIGEGASGSVHEGLYNSMEVAIKKLKTGGLPQQYYSELIESFETEASLMLQFNHPNVIYFYGAGYEESVDGEQSVPFVVCELAAKGSLQSVLCSSEEIDWHQKSKFVLDAAEGMNFLHDKGVIHRDLKSANLLVAKDFTVKVTDFGTSGLAENDEPERIASSDVAQAISSGASPLYAGDIPDVQRSLLTADCFIKKTRGWDGEEKDEIVGTTEWMAPELHMALMNIQDRPQVTHAIDVYAFGIVMWEVATRSLPYGDMDPGPGGSKIRHHVMDGGRPSVPSGCHIPPRYHSLMVEAWETTPSRRPKFSEVLKRLKNVKNIGRSSLTLANSLEPKKNSKIKKAQYYEDDDVDEPLLGSSETEIDA